MCRNISSLLDGKAKELFWRLYKSVKNINWNGLCAALRQQFRHDRDDGDIEELIRQRKQKKQETFDHFYDEICSLLDKMDTPLSNSKLVRILKNNLRPEILHDILNVDITCVSHLREVYRRRESFFDDVKRTHEYAKRMPFKRDITKIQDDLVVK